MAWGFFLLIFTRPDGCKVSIRDEEFAGFTELPDDRGVFLSTRHMGTIHVRESRSEVIDILRDAARAMRAAGSV
jgi:hypothetical protein